jgi:predicted transcriptional regulator
MEMILTPLGKRLLEALKERNDWMTGSEVAEVIGRGRTLTQFDRNTLSQLAALGLIEMESRVKGVVKEYFVYRAKREG